MAKNRKPTVLQINVTANSGSTGRIAEDIGHLLQKNNWNAYIAYGRKKSASELTTIKIGNKHDQYLHAIVTRVSDRHGLGSIRATERLIIKIREIKPSVIHLHNIHGYYINYVILFNFLKQANIPLIWTLHDCWPFTGHCTYFESIGCTKWTQECYACPQLDQYPASILLDNSRNNYILKKKVFTGIDNITIVAVSEWLKTKIADSFLGTKNCQVIYNGIDTSIFYPCSGEEFREANKLTGKFIILGVANVWDDRKGLRDYLELSRRLDKDYCIILVGLNKRQAKKLPANIMGITRTEKLSALTDIYSAADLLLNLSAEESFGMVTAEAMACGTPVLAYNSSANPELITAKTGMVIEKGDINQLVNAIAKMKTNGKAMYTKQCVERIKTQFDKNITYLNYLELYNSLINIKPTGIE
jgi:glycosyltransferase involved in cell wall biosynthesis